MKKKKLTGTYYRTYVSKKNGKRRYVYLVSGSKEALAEYEEFQGDDLRYLDDDPEQMLFFSSILTQNGDIVRQTDEDGRDYYTIGIDFESAVMLSAAENKYSSRQNTDDSDIKPREKSEKEPAKETADATPQPKKRISRK